MSKYMEILIGDLFDNAIDINDTIWYTEHETLFDAIMRTIDEVEELK